MKINLNKLKEKILELQELGFDFDADLLGDDKNGLVNELKSYSDEVGEIDLWLIIREFGNSCFWLDGKPIINDRRYSKNTSTIIYEQYFLNYSLSYVFEELKRITNGKFEYEVIKEFGTTENDKEFWKHLDEKQGDDHFDCEYIIGKKPVNIRYNFFKPDWTYLEPNFLTMFIKNNLDYIKSLNVNYLEPEEFMTFFCINKENQRLLKNKPSIFINNDLSFEQVQQKNNQIDTSVTQSQTVKRWWKFWE
jgi:hypothetical protein